MDEKRVVRFKILDIPAIVTTIIGVLGVFLITFLSAKPSLRWEILPVTNFTKDSVKISIVNIKVFNSGGKECEDVALKIDLGVAIDSNNVLLQKSNSTLPILKTFGSRDVSCFIPYLNPDDEIIFSFFTNSNTVEENKIRVDLRGKGINGKGTRVSYSNIPKWLIIGTIGMFILAITLVSIIVFHHQD